jgi:hypothetical protein
MFNPTSDEAGALFMRVPHDPQNCAPLIVLAPQFGQFIR